MAFVLAALLLLVAGAHSGPPAAVAADAVAADAVAADATADANPVIEAEVMPVLFPSGPWPWYAQGEISMDPQPAAAGQPTQICAAVINTDPLVSSAVLLEFAVAPLGIAVPFSVAGRVELSVPADGPARGCITWVPSAGGAWGVQVTLMQSGSSAQVRQWNVDVGERLVPGESHQLVFLVRNPNDGMAEITLGLIGPLPGWGFELSQDVLQRMAPGEARPVTLTVTPPAETPLPDGEVVLVDVEAYISRELIGGLRKLYRPPVLLHRFPEPPYAESEISIEPYPPRAGEPVQVCVTLRNPTDTAREVAVQYAWAPFGLGLPYTPIDGVRPLSMPAYSMVKNCIHWVPAYGGNQNVRVELLMEGYAPQVSTRQIDADEPLLPGVAHALTFPVSNPTEKETTIQIGIVPHLEGWGFELSADVLPNMGPGEIREVMLTTTPASGQPLPDAAVPVVDVEAYIDGELVGGFRKVLRPPVVLHRTPDPDYAEGEISIEPYPPRSGEPVEVCVQLRNPADTPRDVSLQYAWAPFGLGLPYTPIDGLRPVNLPAYSIVMNCIHWVPALGGNQSIRVELLMDGYAPQVSTRQIDAGEPLEPGVPHGLPFPVANPLNEPVTITLGIIPRVPDWGFELSADVLPNMGPGEIRQVILTTTPPVGEPLPEDGRPIVDVEAYAGGRLIGGFRKIYQPPVPIHRAGDPIYAEREIGVDPYPAIPGQPVRLSVEVRNLSDADQVVNATFSIAPFGIGLPFNTADIAPNPVQIYVPARGAASGQVMWSPPAFRGQFCVRVALQVEGLPEIWSQRDIDLGEPLRPGELHALVFPVGSGGATEPVTITLGVVNHLPGWTITVAPDALFGVKPGEIVTATLAVRPPMGANLGTGLPITDVEAYVDGRLLGGFRKLDIPPVPIHKPHEKVYAETELSITPEEPAVGQPATISAVIQNSGPDVSTVSLQFGWAHFGMGIPFSTSGISPSEVELQVSPAMTATASVTWVPEFAGTPCVQVRLRDAQGIYGELISQRNVRVIEAPPCGASQTYTFTVQNATDHAVTVDVGTMTLNVPSDWEVTVEPTSLVLAPGETATCTVTIKIPCPVTAGALAARETVRALQEAAGSVATVNVEGYAEGRLVGGIQLQFPTAEDAGWHVYLPLVMR
jgi:hypothetical protein